jgi:hypothetical protein
MEVPEIATAFRHLTGSGDPPELVQAVTAVTATVHGTPHQRTRPAF